MKILLLKDTPKVGSKNEIVEVKGGHASNYLIPNGYAVMATPDVVERVKEERREAEKKEKKIVEELHENLAKLSKEKISFEAKVNEKGHLFAGIDEKKIVDIIKEKTGINLPISTIDLEGHIKEAGEHGIRVRVGEKKYNLNLIIRAEK